MACTQSLAGLSQVGCDPSKGGILEAYVIPFDNVTGVTLDETSGTTVGKVSNIAYSSDSAETWYKYAFKRGTGSMTSTLNVDDANGVNFVSTDLVLQFNKMDTQKRIEMRALSLGDVRVIVKDANEIYWMLGVNGPVSASAGTGQTGTARTDGNYFQITLQANDDSYPAEVTGEVITDVLAHIVNA